ncbi:MAG: DEAD/DEAH box helicase family protein, partial [Ktedonobacterales bacterium]
AIQCKFFAPSHTLRKEDIDSFFTASGKSPFTSRIIVSTTDKWSRHAEEAIESQQIPVTRLRVQDLEESVIDWSQFSLDHPEFLQRRDKKHLRPHQRIALKRAITGFATVDRGKLIMACGTGKTLTALKIAEELVPADGYVLFLAPSISLLSQTLREWTAEANTPLRCYVVCSDTTVGKRKHDEDMRVQDLAYPATTNARKLVEHVSIPPADTRLTVIFSTYQSIQVLHDAQAAGLPAFDLVICDEAHRTTGVILAGAEESQFVRVHDQAFIQAAKRLYMTATPRIYTDSSKSKAQEHDATLCSMDDERLYGPEFYRLGFADAVESGLLSDYKVMVLAVDEKYISKTFQGQIADASNELSLDDAVKIIGCWNGLARRGAIPEERTARPMRRAVGFARSIKDSQKIANLFASLVAEYRAQNATDDAYLHCEAAHVDGTFNVLKRNELLDWLKA